MADQNSEENSTLRTVACFDRGEICAVGSNNGENLQQFSAQTILVVSLISELCKGVEKNPVKQQKLFSIICNQLKEKNLIDASYLSEEFNDLRNKYQVALFNLVVGAQLCIDNPLTENALNYTFFEVSRFASEYKIMDLIAKGGFGEVYKARHNLDGEVYAVKKIVLRYSNKNEVFENVSEVKLLAGLNHYNIVAYKAAWLEDASLEVDSDDTSSSSSFDDNSIKITSEQEDSGHNQSSSGIIFETSSKDSSSSEKGESLMIVKQKSESFESFDNLPLKPFSNLKKQACLYIQMQLCDTTLRQWLDNRNLSLEPPNDATCLSLFTQIVQGVEYIHSQKIVHHDIKPSNIFVSTDLRQVQVGDFGLACYLGHKFQGSMLRQSHRPGGTRLYAAEEQLKGVCTKQSDIFSLGIVLLELLLPFKTDMERCKVVTRLKSGEIPLELNHSSPTLVKVMKRCTVRSANSRPTAKEVLELLQPEEKRKSAKMIAAKDATIQSLHEEILAKDSEIEDLKRQLAKFTLPSSSNSDSPPVVSC